jgi:hypothetical protein
VRGAWRIEAVGAAQSMRGSGGVAPRGGVRRGRGPNVRRSPGWHVAGVAGEMQARECSADIAHPMCVGDGGG